MSTLSDWSGIIERQGAEHRKREDQEYETLKADVASLNSIQLPLAELLDRYEHCTRNCYDYRPRVAEQFQLAQKAIRAEIERRIA